MQRAQGKILEGVFCLFLDQLRASILHRKSLGGEQAQSVSTVDEGLFRLALSRERGPTSLAAKTTRLATQRRARRTLLVAQPQEDQLFASREKRIDRGRRPETGELHCSFINNNNGEPRANATWTEACRRLVVH